MLKDTPAYEAGIGDGDVLLNADNQDGTPIRDSSVDFMNPPGTKLSLKLRRGDKQFTAKVVLRDIIGPKAAAVPK